MDFESVRPVISGLVGGSLAMLFCRSLSRWFPQVCDEKSAETLIREFRAAIWWANGSFFAGLMGGIAIYQLGILPNTDWRGLAIGAGSGSVAALLTIALLALVTGRDPKEAYVAYALSQRTPAVVMYGILLLLAAAFAAACASLLTN